MVFTRREYEAELRAHIGRVIAENKKLKQRVRQLEHRLDLWSVRWKARAR